MVSDNLLYAAGGLFASEVIGVTNFTPVGSGGGGSDSGGSGSGIPPGIAALLSGMNRSGRDIELPSGTTGGISPGIMAALMDGGESAQQYIPQRDPMTIIETATGGADIPNYGPGNVPNIPTIPDIPDIPGVTGGNMPTMPDILGGGTGDESNVNTRAQSTGFKLQDLAGTNAVGTGIATVGESGKAGGSAINDIVTGTGDIIGAPNEGGIIGGSYATGQYAGSSIITVSDAIGSVTGGGGGGGGGNEPDFGSRMKEIAGAEGASNEQVAKAMKPDFGSRMKEIAGAEGASNEQVAKAMKSEEKKKKTKSGDSGGSGPLGVALMPI